jgi:nucleotidyltransferase substrate binding protein (TIGR01987 family)
VASTLSAEKFALSAFGRARRLRPGGSSWLCSCRRISILSGPEILAAICTFPGNLSLMAPGSDVRWIQRFENYRRALESLREAVQLARQRKLSRLEQQGLIQAFEFTHELAWNTLKDFLGARNHPSRVYGSRDATREAFAADLIEDGDVWMKMLESRNATTHTYAEAVADRIAEDILALYFPEFEKLRETLAELAEKEKK